MLKFGSRRSKNFFLTNFRSNTETLKNRNVQVFLTMIINQELEAAILQYGKDVCVIEPESLKNKISEILKEALNNY